VKRAVVLPDVQAGPGRSNRHMTWAGNYVAAKQFDIVIQLGDLGDFPSLSSYDKGKASFEGRRLTRDWDAFRASVDAFMQPWAGKKYKPRLVYTEGNHEFRIKRAMEDNPELVGSLPDPCAYLTERGWECYPYLTVARVEGVLVSHLFPRTLTGRVTSGSLRYGSPSANHMIRANMASCIAGHKPGFDYATVPGAGSKSLHGLIAGSFYTHRELYVGPGNDVQWKGVVTLNGLHNGQYDVCPVGMRHLKERYG
jgi:hypothetical protein